MGVALWRARPTGARPFPKQEPMTNQPKPGQTPSKPANPGTAKPAQPAQPAKPGTPAPGKPGTPGTGKPKG